MWKLSDLIGDQEEPEVIEGFINTNDLPIPMPEQLDWTYRKDPRRLTKMFKFGTESKFNSFMMDVLEHQAETQHHARITMQYPQIKIEAQKRLNRDLSE